ncbi:MAG: N-acetyltransferase family protein [Granulosicoccus sp.]
MNIQIRQATESDADQILDIYRPIVEHTAISFEIETPSTDDISNRINAVLDTHDWLVAVDTDEVVGYAPVSINRGTQGNRLLRAVARCTLRDGVVKAPGNEPCSNGSRCKKNPGRG